MGEEEAVFLATLESREEQLRNLEGQFDQTRAVHACLCDAFGDLVKELFENDVSQVFFCDQL